MYKNYMYESVFAELLHEYIPTAHELAKLIPIYIFPRAVINEDATSPILRNFDTFTSPCTLQTSS